ncbi:MAG: hypothetical protein LE179_02500 [Endomicrobium sp.]|nr:hypothetical protein [Endomicrobium sp.]
MDIARQRIDSIKTLSPEASWEETRRTEQIKVPFVDLVKKNIVRSGEVLYTCKRYNKKAKVLNNGKLLFENNIIGSIHRIGAMIQQALSCNGWKFWYVLKDNKVLLLDDLRTEYLQDNFK